MFRNIIAAALAAACLLLPVPAHSTGGNWQGLFRYSEKPQKVKAYKPRRHVKRYHRVRHAKRHYSRRYVTRSRDARPSQGNIFRRYAVASSSRACLTSATASILNALEARVGPVSIVSTCRPGALIAGSGVALRSIGMGWQWTFRPRTGPRPSLS